jgi:hypothetical protein
VRIKPALLLPVLLAWSQAAAEQRSTLQLSGIVRPAACAPSFANDGVVDFGAITPQTLPRDSPARLEKKTINLTIDCVAPTRIALAFSAHRFVPGVRAAYGMSRIGARWIGLYDMNLETGSAVADGKPMHIFTARRYNGKWQRKTPGLALKPTHRYAWRTQDDLAHAASNFSVNISVQPTVMLGGRSMAPGPVSTSGSATLDILYP